MKHRLVGVVLALALGAGGDAAARPVPTQQSRIDAAIAEAAQSAGLPRSWIAALARAESARDPTAISPAGAMGLMQLMPATWRELRVRLALGADPFDIRDNLLAGAHYLREMFDRFGPSGFLAAYNAGPGRYVEHLAGRPLPPETREYVARLSADISGAAAAPGKTAAWTHSPLFPKLEDEAEN